MSTQRKQRWVHAFLVGLALWPLVHIVLVLRYDVNPWKLAGWGMYSAPQLAHRLEILGHAPGGGALRLPALPEDLVAVVANYNRLRRGLGRLVEPDEVARAVFGYEGGPEAITIRITKPVLNRKTGMIEERIEDYEYRRAGPGGG